MKITGRPRFYSVHWKTLRRGEPGKVEAPAVDMLRYDVAFTAEKFPDVVAFPTFQGFRKNEPTLARWSSFCQVLVRLDYAASELVERSWTAQPEAWYTLRRPAAGAAAGSFVKVTLAAYLKAKNREDLDAAAVPFEEPELGRRR